ncbi:PEP-CTERM sorting domain-containing protein [Roseateles sp.]|uniref:PEP-CTERM sorting domain-containing protein n=1 Tax=Roseateles sp. TaxID=1971397 RepID=UPI003BABF7BA
MNVKSLLSKIATAAALTAAAAAAQADTYQFTLTGAYNATWQMQSTIEPDDPYEGQGFIVWDVAGTFPGASTGLVDLTFYHGDLGGGVQIDDFYGDATLLIADGPQLYTGSELNPTFNLGTFALTEYQGTASYTLTVTNLSAVPEPASIALLLGGLGLVGAAAARRRKTEEEALEA